MEKDLIFKRMTDIEVGFASAWLQWCHDAEIGRIEMRSLGAVMKGRALLATSHEIPNATSPAPSP